MEGHFGGTKGGGGELFSDPDKHFLINVIKRLFS